MYAGFVGAGRIKNPDPTVFYFKCCRTAKPLDSISSIFFCVVLIDFIICSYGDYFCPGKGFCGGKVEGKN